MNKQLAIWKFIHDCLSEQDPVMLLFVLESKGSSPGRPGFFMGVAASGRMQGSIGGGIMEHKLVERAKDKLHGNGEEHTLRRQIHSKDATHDRSGMICSGEETVWLYRLQVADVAALENIIECLENNRNGMLRLTPAGIGFNGSQVPEKDFYFQHTSDSDWWYEERLGYKNHLFVIGGGHCALAFSRLMSELDFCIHLYDDRAQLNTFIQNAWVQEKNLIADYTQLKDIIRSGPHHYVVIMTFGYRTDDVALRALWDKDFAYLGVMGSARKIEEMFAVYRSEGKSEAFLKNIHAPVGLPIHSRTPEEIAVSIAAEIIKVKNEHLIMDLGEPVKDIKGLDSSVGDAGSGPG